MVTVSGGQTEPLFSRAPLASGYEKIPARFGRALAASGMHKCSAITEHADRGHADDRCSRLCNRESGGVRNCKV